MQKCTSFIVAFSFLMVTACGRNPGNGFATQMSQSEALDVLTQVKVDEPSSSGSIDSKSEAVTVQNLESLIQDLVQSGQLKVPSKARGAIQSDGTINTDTLNKVVTMLAQGKNAFQVAKGVVQAASGSATQAKFDLDSIAAILTAALPFVTAIAPQFVPVISAVIAMLPIIKGFLALFQKPAST